MRLVMMGTGPFAVPTFLSLLDSSHEMLALVTRPAAPSRGRGPAPPQPMREAAEARGVAVFAPASINSPEAHALLSEWKSDLLVVCDYGQILKSATLALARLGGINLHGSLLPRYRGAAPVHWSIYHGDEETGVSVIHMTPQLDGGPILALRRTAIRPDETTAQLEPRLADLGVDPVHEAIQLLQTWDGHSTLGTPQNAAEASRAPRLTKADGLIGWSRSARQIGDQVRAFQPWPGSYTHWTSPKGESVRLIITQVTAEPATSMSAAAGTVMSTEGLLRIATGEGCLVIHRLQPAGRRAMDASEFLRGHAVQVGDVLA